MTPLQQLLLLCGVAGLILGVLLILAGLHELSHRGRTAGYDRPSADEILAAPRHRRW